MKKKPAKRRGSPVSRLVVGASLVVPLLTTACGATTVITTPPEPIVKAVSTPSVTSTPRPRPSITPTRRATRTPASPTPTATIYVPPSPTPIVYTVKERDTLLALATHFGVLLDQLMAVNNIAKPEDIQVGQQLVIPVIAAVLPTIEPIAVAPSATAEASVAPELVNTQVPVTETIASVTNPLHFVKVGETLSVIANIYGVQLEDLLSANGLSADVQLTAGDALLIPRGVYTPIPTMTPIPIPNTPTITPVSEPVIAAAPPTATATSIPATAVPPTPTVAPSAVVYEVQRGDVPAAIAARYGVTTEALLAANPNLVPSLLRPGDKLVIPGTQAAAAASAPTTLMAALPTPDGTLFIEHTITAGETITDLYSKYDISYEKLVTYNILGDPNKLAVGQVVRIALGTPTPTPTVIPSPTMTPTPLPAYLPPQPLLPANGTLLNLAETPIVLNWTASGFLQPNEYYLVRLRLYDGNGALLQTVTNWVQTTSWRPGDEVLPSAAGRYTYMWDVTVMRQTSRVNEPLDGTPLSGRSLISQFDVTYTP